MSPPVDGWRVVRATFELSAPTVGNCPPSSVPEIAIGGRSNVGKSSLINALCNVRALARVSRTPGRTQLLNLFRLRLRGPQGRSAEFRCVDLPGYGYAAVRKEVRSGFAPLIESYLGSGRNLAAMVLLVDLRRGVLEHDQRVLDDLAARKVPTLLVATKVDKLTASARGSARARMADKLGIDAGDIVMTSASRRQGLWGTRSLAEDLAGLVADPVSSEGEAL